MLLTPPAYLQAGSYSALLDRHYLVTVLTMRNMNVTHAAKQGFYADRYPAYSNPSGMDIVVGPNAGVIANTFAADAGDYRYSNPSNTSATLTGSSPTQNRNDIIGFQVKDNFYDGSGLNSAILAVIQGTNAAGVPVDPAMPASFIPVFRAVVSAGVTSPTLQDLRVRTVAAGSLPVDSAAQRTALGTPYAGYSIWRTDRAWEERWDGSAWRVQGTAITTNTTDRDSAVTSPAVGSKAVTTVDGQTYRRTATAWVADRVWRSDQILLADAANINLSGIPDYFRQLRVVWSARTSAVVISNNMQLRVNGNAGLNYFENGRNQQQATMVNYANAGAAGAYCGALAGDSAQASARTSGEVILNAWNAPGGRTAVNGTYTAHMYDTLANSYYSDGGFLVNVAGPYTQITMLSNAGNLRAGSMMTVYGME